MKQKHFIFAFLALLSCFTITANANVAKVGDTPYATLSEAIAAAEGGATVTFIADVTSSDIITIDKAITLDGNGYTLTSTAGRAINVDVAGDVVIKNLAIDAKGERAINIINQPANVTVESVTATAKNYAVMLATSATGADLTINKSNLTGLATVNVASADSKVVITDTEITNLDATETENYGAISVFKTATNSTVTVKGGKIVVGDDSMAASIGVESATVSFEGTEGADKVQYAFIYNGDAGYPTLAEAVAEAEEGDVITLCGNVSSSDIITIDKAITLDGKGKTLTSTAGRAINVDTQNGAITTTIKNLTIVGDKDCQRGINIIDGSYKDTPANVTLDGVKISGVSTYGVQLATSVGSGNTITIKNSEISSWIALNINGDNQSVTVENSKLYGTAYSATDEGNTITVTGKNTIVTMTGGVISAATSEGLIGHYCGHVVEPTSNIVLNSVEAKVANEGDEVITFAVAIIEGQDGSFRTLQEALDDYAKEGDKVILLRPITVAANENVVFDLKGSTIVANAIEGAAYSAITNKGTLTIKNGTIKCNSTSSSTAYAVNTITNCGALTIENATIQNVGTGSQIGYAIDNNSTSADATLVIGEGAVIEVSGSNYFDGIRQFCNSTTAENSVTVNGGKVSSIWMQNPSDGAEGKNTKDVKGAIAINGGEVGALYLEPSATFEAAITGGYVGSISYFQEAEGRNLTAFISGGTFGMDVTDFCAEDFACQVGEDGKYSIMSTILESYEIVDGVHGNYTNKVDMTVGTLTYERTLLSAGMWNALYLPFEIELTEEFLGNYEVAYFNDIRSYDNDNNGEIDDMDMEIIHIYEGTLKANYPYLIKAKTEDVRKMKLELSNVKLYKAEENAVTCSSVFMNFAVKGSYSMKDVNDLNGALVITTNGAWEQTTDGLKPFRLYLTMEPREGSPVKVSEQAMARVRIVTRGESTDIENTKLDANTSNAIYDLQGRRVENPTTGIYIVNGKKMYIENK